MTQATQRSGSSASVSYLKHDRLDSVTAGEILSPLSTSVIVVFHCDNNIPSPTLPPASVHFLIALHLSLHLSLCIPCSLSLFFSVSLPVSVSASFPSLDSAVSQLLPCLFLTFRDRLGSALCVAVFRLVHLPHTTMLSLPNIAADSREKPPEALPQTRATVCPTAKKRPRCLALWDVCGFDFVKPGRT